MAAGWSLLVICVLHTVVFAPNPWWGEWLTGMLRVEPLPVEAISLFWALPGGFVVPGGVLAAMIIGQGRRGRTAPAYVAPALVAWAALCIWIVGPSGFITAVVPATLMVIARVRARRRASRRAMGGAPIIG